jgi:hypothetical protein
MRIRSFVQHDLARLTELTIETFRPFYEDSFRPLMGEVVFANQHGNWRDDYRKQVAEWPGASTRLVGTELSRSSPSQPSTAATTRAPRCASTPSVRCEPSEPR